jgi:hypothetical protein
MIGYPTPGLDLGDRNQSPRTVLLAISALTLAVLVGLTPAKESAYSGDGDDGSRP